MWQLDIKAIARNIFTLEGEHKILLPEISFRKVSVTYVWSNCWRTFADMCNLEMAKCILTIAGLTYFEHLQKQPPLLVGNNYYSLVWPAGIICSILMKFIFEACPYEKFIYNCSCVFSLFRNLLLKQVSKCNNFYLIICKYRIFIQVCILLHWNTSLSTPLAKFRLFAICSRLIDADQCWSKVLIRRRS